jgi:hypothetical protein
MRNGIAGIHGAIRASDELFLSHRTYVAAAGTTAGDDVGRDIPVCEEG